MREVVKITKDITKPKIGVSKESLELNLEAENPISYWVERLLSRN